MVDLYTDWTVCSLKVGASESERRPCFYWNASFGHKKMIEETFPEKYKINEIYLFLEPLPEYKKYLDRSGGKLGQISAE